MEKSGTNIASHLFYIALLPEIAKDLFEELKKISQISRHDPFKARSLGLICNIPALPPPPPQAGLLRDGSVCECDISEERGGDPTDYTV